MTLLSQEYQTLLDAIPDGITLHNPDLKIVWANQAASRSLGVGSEKLEGRFCCEILMQRVHTEADCPVSQTFKLGEGVHMHDVAVADCFWDIRTIPIKADFGDVQKVICVIRDVTQTRLWERQLRQSQKMEAIGTLAGGIAHDFNNILAAIIGFGELAMQHPRLAPEIRPHLLEIFKAGLRAKDLVQQIVDFSRLGNKQTLPLKMETVVTDTLNLLRSTLPPTIVIETHFHCQRMVEADANQMRQLIANLCTNAARAMAPKGGSLVISLQDRRLEAPIDAVWQELNPGDYVCLKVQDSGHGMTAPIMERVFEPYFTTNGVGQGSGLGLAVAHGIVKAHQGAIQVESVPGRGSTFTVFLPAVVRQPSPAVQSLLEGQIPGGSERILFVDDEQGLAGLGEQMLRRLGYAVKSCTSPQKALSLVQSDPKAFDLLISDLTMPQMTGLALAEGCKRVKPDLRVIICTGHSDLIPQDQAQATRLGIRIFLQKPARLQDLASAIRGVLDIRDESGKMKDES